MDRRTFILQSGTIASAAMTSLAFPGIAKAYNRKPTIKVVGTHVTLQESIRLQAEKDLGIADRKSVV